MDKKKILLLICAMLVTVALSWGMTTIIVNAAIGRETNDTGNTTETNVTGTPTEAPDLPVYELTIDEKSFPDPAFREYIIKEIDFDNNGKLSSQEIEWVSIIDVEDMQIKDLKGIELFTGLESINCEKNQLTTLDTSNNKKIKHIYAGHNLLESINITQNTELTDLFICDNLLTQLDLTNNAKLEVFDCIGNYIRQLNLSNCQNLKRYYWDSGVAVILDNEETAANGTLINTLHFKDSAFVDYILKNIDTNGDGILSKEEAEAVTEIKTSRLGISDYTGIEHFVNLRKLDCSYTFPGNWACAWKLDISQCPNLEELNCSNSNLRTIDVSNNPKLRILQCDSNDYMTELDVSNNPELYELFCNDNNIRMINVSQNTNLSEYRFDDNVKLIWDDSKVDKTGIAINEENFPDEIFRKYISDNLDLDCNDVLSDYEIKSLKKLEVFNKGVVDFTGIGYFTELIELDIGMNECHSIDLSKNKKLQVVWFDCNCFTELDFSANKELREAYISRNNLKKVNLSENAKLEVLQGYENELTELDVSNNLKLRQLWVAENPALTQIYVPWTSLYGSLDVEADCELIFRADGVSFEY